MKKIFALLIVFATFSCSSNAQKTAFTKEALNEKLLSYTDNQVSFNEIIKKHEGKTVVIEIWASWCGDCIKAMPKLKELQAKNPEAEYVFISMDKTADKWKAGIEKQELKGDHYMANDGMGGIFGKAIDLDWIPRYLILDKTGKIVIYRAIETDFDKLNDSLQKLK